MIYLALAVVLGAGIYWVFKYAGQRQLDLFSVIMLNYPVCVLIGSIHIFFSVGFDAFSVPTILWSAGIALLFITMFNLMAQLTKKEGVATSSIVSRVSMILPTLFFFGIHGHAMSLFNWVGLLLALVAVFLLNFKAKGESLVGWLPLIVFLGYGAVDIVLKLAEMQLGHEEGSFHLLSTGTFFFAGLYGLVYKGFKGIKRDKQHVGAGVFLGMINYYAILFFLFALNKSSFSAAVIFPLNGILILALATLGSIFIFKEKVSRQKLMALGLAVGAIVLLSGDGEL